MYTFINNLMSLKKENTLWRGGNICLHKLDQLDAIFHTDAEYLARTVMYVSTQMTKLGYLLWFLVKEEKETKEG